MTKTTRFIKNNINFSFVFLIATVAAGCANNNLHIVQETEGDNVLSRGEFGDSNLGVFSQVAMADSSVSTRIDLERTPSSVVITNSRSGEEIVRWSGEKTFAWQHLPLGEGKTRRLTVTVTTPSQVPLVGPALPDTEEVWLAVLVNDRLVDLDEYLDGCASDESRDEPRVRTRRPVQQDDEEAPTARRPRTSREDRDERTVERSPRRNSGGGRIGRREQPRRDTSDTSSDRSLESDERPVVLADSAEDQFDAR